MFTVSLAPQAPVTPCDLCVSLDLDAPATSDAGSRLCPDHRSAVRSVLLDLDHWFQHVSSPTFLRSTRDQDTERWVGSKAPVDTHTLGVLDRRTVALSKGDPVSPERVLRAWLYAILDNVVPDRPAGPWTHDHPMPRFTMTALIAMHLSLLDWTLAQPSAVRYARHLAAVRRQVVRLIPNF